MTADVEEFEDDLLVELKRRCDAKSFGFFNGLDVAHDLANEPKYAHLGNPTVFAHEALRRIEIAGFFQCGPTRWCDVSLITKSGVERIRAIDEKRRPKSVLEKILSEQSLKWIIVGTFVFTLVGVAIMAAQLWFQLSSVAQNAQTH